MGDQAAPALVAANVTVEREGLPVVRDVTIEVPAGQITVLLGLNGAGKTTLLECLSGVLPLRSGEVSLDGTRIDRLSPYARARRGLSHVEQGRTVILDMTTRDNLLIASADGDLGAVLSAFPSLERRLGVDAGVLSGGEQQMLMLARAFLRRPRVMLIDELSLGLAPMVVEQLLEAVGGFAGTGVGVLLVEQFAQLALAAGSTAYVLRGGAIVHHGRCAALLSDPGLVERLYLGETSDVDVR